MATGMAGGVKLGYRGVHERLALGPAALFIADTSTGAKMPELNKIITWFQQRCGRGWPLAS